MSPVMTILADLYEPIAEKLRAVQSLFDQELHCDLPFVEELCEHIQRYRGKMLRPALHLLSARACGEITREHITIAAALEMVHMATLVHDDVLDDATMRRSASTLNSMTNNETAVLVGDFLISHAYHLCSSEGLQYASHTVASCTNTVCEGELMQVHSRDNWDLTEDEYMTIVSRKTASLTSVASMLGAKYAGADAKALRALESFGMDVGVAFQIVDDILDIVGSEREMGKTLGRDLDEGKLTLPMIHFMNSAPRAQREQFKRICRNRTPHRQEQIQHWLNGSIEYAFRVAHHRVEAAIAGLDCLPASPAQESLVALAEFIVQRRV